jgi:hypothetical protein
MEVKAVSLNFLGDQMILKLKKCISRDCVGLIMFVIPTFPLIKSNTYRTGPYKSQFHK